MTIERVAARALLIADEAVLLIQGFDPQRPDNGKWWITPGGGIDDGESPAAAAAREIFEETGLLVAPHDLGPIVATRTAEFDFEGKHYLQRESFFAVKVAPFTAHTHGWDTIEQRTLLAHRWWTVGDLAATTETVYPLELPELMRAVIAGGCDLPMVLSGR